MVAVKFKGKNECGEAQVEGCVDEKTEHRPVKLTAIAAFLMIVNAMKQQ